MEGEMKVVDGGKKDIKAEVDIKYARANVYFGPQVKLLVRLAGLALKHRGVSVSGLIVTCVQACIDTLEEEIPTKRKFKLNGKVVEP